MTTEQLVERALMRLYDVAQEISNSDAQYGPISIDIGEAIGYLYIAKYKEE